MKSTGTFASSDRTSTVYYSLWEPEEKPVGVLQIIHGMSEYIDRYEDFALYLNGFGFVVAGTDHIGHGRSADPKDYGYMGEKDGWMHMVDDEERFHQILREKYPDLKVSVLGHSMGSFIIRTWMAKYGKNTGKFIIMGTAGKNPAAAAGIAIVKALRLAKGGHGRSKLVTAMAFGSYNKRIPDAKTNNDWLSRDSSVVEKYIADPACGFTFTLAGYEDLFRLISFVNEDSWYKAVPKTQPILVTAGAEDPVGNYGEGPVEVAVGLRKAGCESVDVKLYDGMRHEILNEFGKEQVYEDIKNFLIG